jgi:DNA-binding transcriptional MocR family regulator
MIYLCLSSFIGADEEAWPSLSTLATMSGISVSTVQRCLAELRDAGLVQWSGRVRPDGGQTSNLYRLETNPPGQVDHPPQSEGPPPLVTVTNERTSEERPQLNVTSPQGTTKADTVSDVPDWVKKIEWITPEKWVIVQSFAQHADPVAALGHFRAWSEEHDVSQSFSRFWQWLAKAEAQARDGQKDEDVNVRAMRAYRQQREPGA